MTDDLAGFILRESAVVSLACAVALVLRAPFRRFYGACAAYALWIIVPIATVAAFLPPRTIEIAVEDGLLHSAETAANAVLAAEPAAAAKPVFDATLISNALVAIWIAGAAVSFGIALISHMRCARRLRQGGLSSGPAAIGVFFPRIVLPADFGERFSEEERELVIAHERAHIDAGDLQANAVATFFLCLNWFNPIVRIAHDALRTDQELACDARVLARRPKSRIAYAQALLKSQTGGSPSFAAALTGYGRILLRLRQIKELQPQNRAGSGRAATFAACLAAGVTAWLAQPVEVAYASPGSERAGSDSALIAAILDRNDEQAAALIVAGADVNEHREGDGTPLIAAAKIGARDIARRLIAAGADARLSSPGDGDPLIVAAARGDAGMARLLLDAGADANAFVPDDETPLINAARSGDVETARLLIGAGADVNLKVEAETERGVILRSPLGEAKRLKRREMAKFLLGEGAQD